MPSTDTTTTPHKIEVYIFIVEMMKQNCSHETCQKLDRLSRAIEQGFESPATNSINIFGTNLFINDYSVYLEMYSFVNGGLS